MKLFQRLLVAPAALGLLAPMAVNAAELNLNGVSDYSDANQEVQSFSDVYPTDWAFQALTNLAETHGCNVSIPSETISRYEAAALLNKCLSAVSTELTTEERRLIDEFSSELAVIESRIDGIDEGVGEFEAGQFSSTTTMSGAAVFNVGSASDGGTDDTLDSFYMTYAYGIDLNTSFRGTDTLYVGVESGNASSGDPFANMDSAVTNGAGLQVTSMFYSFPIGNVEITAGPLLDQDDVIAATPSVYSDAFRHGSLPFSAAGDETGSGVALAYANDAGFVTSVSYIAVDGFDAAKGLASNDGSDVTTFSAGYNGDGFGAGLVIAYNDGDNSDGYDTFGGGVYWTPESMPATFSVTYDSKNPETGDDSTDLFLGIEYETGPGTLGIAYHSTDVDGSTTLDEIGYEVVYSYPVNDNITVVPGLFFAEETTAGKQDDTGVFVETTFSF